ncbi:MAG TPA: hypothetical protein VLB47_15030 [Solirubrobacteraceae bacterium]|nr:hypothetical protein [Solirubrobacteraceae bacterium]
MARATLTPPATRTEPRPRASALERAPWPALALLALVAGAVALFVAYPTFPNYDSYYSLLWGKELLHGTRPSFEAYRAPTEHPLAIAFGALLSLLGDGADRVMVGATFASFVALAVGMYELGRRAFGVLAGLVAGALVCTRFDFPFLALRAYIDIPYLALVVWAAALEATRPRRGVAVLALLTAAGLLRPEAWLLAGLYWLYLFPHATWPQRVRLAALTAVAPLTWAGLDLAVTGNPLFSLTHTSGLAEELGRSRGLSSVPRSTVRFLQGLDKAPVLAGGVVGVVLAATLFRARSRVPLALLGAGLGTWVLVTVSGLSVIFRYLLVPALMIMVFAALAITGWTLLERGTRARRWWALAAGLLVAYGIVFTVTRVTPSHFTTELTFRGRSHESLVALFDDPRVRAAMRCGPISVPNHRLVPEVRWIAGAGEDGVLPRSDRTRRRQVRRGVAIYAADREALRRFGYSPDPIRVAIPMQGFERIAVDRYFSAYARC